MGKWLAPVEFEFVGLAVDVKLLEGGGKRGADFGDAAGVRKDKLAFRLIAIFCRVLVYLEKHVVAVAKKTQVEGLRVAVPP
jgi:hypothetical protein